MVDTSGDTIRTRRALSIIAGVAVFCALDTIILLSLGWFDSESLRWTDRDFSNYWLASKLILEGNALDLFRGHNIYFGHMQRVFGPDFPWHSWSYPPHFLMLIWPLAFVPYGISMVLFLSATLLIYLHAAFLALRRHPNVPVFFLFPFLICNVFSAQNGFITAALLLYGLTLRSSRPIIAGIAIGMLTVKPQLGILLPVFLLFERRWLVISSAAITAVSMMLLATLIFGVGVWTGYLQETWPYQTIVMNHGTGIFINMMLSTFAAMRSLEYDMTVANYVHMPIAIAALLVFGWTLFRFTQPDTVAASFIFATFLVSPYSLVYDLGAVVVLSAAIFRRPSADLLACLIYAMIALLPLISPVASLFGFPIAPLFLAAGWFMLIHQQEKSRTAFV